MKKNELNTFPELKKRDAFSHKGDYGHALIVAGHKGTMGAAVISASAGLKSGVGLLTVSVPSDERVILQCAVPEAMLVMREDALSDMDRFSSLGIGPGLGVNDATEELLAHCLLNFKSAMVLDADALTILSKNKTLLDDIPQNSILTPHAGEFDRLFGAHESHELRLESAICYAKKFNVIIVLKGHLTAIVSSQEVFHNKTGNSGLAKGGSGDALTGVITSFLAQGYVPIDAARLGVYLHGLAADITLKYESKESMTIMNVIHNFGEAFKQLGS